MGRVVSGASSYFREARSAAIGSWDRFFFRPADPLPVGLIRLGVGGLLAWNWLALLPDLRDFLGPDGWIGVEALAHYDAARHARIGSFWARVPGPWLGAAWGLVLGVYLAFAAGLWSRLTAALSWAIAVSTCWRMPAATYAFDQMIATLALYLAAGGASGRAASVDAWRAGRRGGPAGPRPSVAANLTLRMIQLHLAIVYGSSGLSKLMGREWWDGSALGMILQTPEFQGADLGFLLGMPALVQAGTHLAVWAEILYPVLIWHRLWRPLLLAAIVALHAGIALVLGLAEFSALMIAANLAFVPGAWLRGAFAPAGAGRCAEAARGDGPAPAASPPRRHRADDPPAIVVGAPLPPASRRAARKAAGSGGPRG